MSIQHPQTYTDVDLNEMIAAARQARAEELAKMFRNICAIFAGFFMSKGIVAAQA